MDNDSTTVDVTVVSAIDASISGMLVATSFVL